MRLRLLCPAENCTNPAIDDFPRDLFTDKQRQDGAVVIHALIALYLFAALAVVCEKYFVPAVERICHGECLAWSMGKERDGEGDEGKGRSEGPTGRGLKERGGEMREGERRGGKPRSKRGRARRRRREEQLKGRKSTRKLLSVLILFLFWGGGVGAGGELRSEALLHSSSPRYKIARKSNQTMQILL